MVLVSPSSVRAERGRLPSAMSIYTFDRTPPPYRGVHGNENRKNDCLSPVCDIKSIHESHCTLRFIVCAEKLAAAIRKIDPPSGPREPRWPTNARSPSRFTVDKDLGHRRLKLPHLTTLISHRTVRFSPHPGSGIARGAQANAPDRRCQNTFAHPLAALLM